MPSSETFHHVHKKYRKIATAKLFRQQTKLPTSSQSSHPSFFLYFPLKFPAATSQAPRTLKN